MSDLTVRAEHIQPASGKPQALDAGKRGTASFGNYLKETISEINKLQGDADKAIAKVQMDNSASIHEAIIALEKANISFRTMMQVRNKIIEAYQEVMRMQV
jgi:flagellar hook-basal body complex protein FliE